MMKRAFVALVGMAMAGAASAALSVGPGEKIAFLGDSITQLGDYYPCGYVNLVMNGLETLGVKAEKVPAGICGNKSNDMLARVDKDVLEKHPKWMTFSCGVNDVWHDTLYTPAAGVKLPDYEANVKAIFDKCDKAGVKVLVLTATMITEDEKDEKNVRLETYNDFLRAEAKRRGYPLADLAKAMRAKLAEIRATDNGPGNKLTLDGVHMAYPGNVMMAWGVLKALGAPESRREEVVRKWNGIVGSYRMDIVLSADQWEAISRNAKKARIGDEFVYTREAAMSGAFMPKNP